MEIKSNSFSNKIKDKEAVILRIKTFFIKIEIHAISSSSNNLAKINNKASIKIICNKLLNNFSQIFHKININKILNFNNNKCQCQCKCKINI